MSDIELAVVRVKALEGLLEGGLGATGRGLHEKVTSVQGRLPPGLVRKLRFVATVRNKVVHEAAVRGLDDRAGFERACAEAERELRALARPPAAARRGRRWVVVLLLLAAAALAALWWLA